MNVATPNHLHARGDEILFISTCWICLATSLKCYFASIVCFMNLKKAQHQTLLDLNKFDGKGDFVCVFPIKQYVNSFQFLFQTKHNQIQFFAIFSKLTFAQEEQGNMYILNHCFEVLATGNASQTLTSLFACQLPKPPHFETCTPFSQSPMQKILFYSISQNEKLHAMQTDYPGNQEN